MKQFPQNDNCTINTVELIPGVYLVRIKSSKNEIVRKL